MNLYTPQYFRERDLLIPHLAQTIKKIMLENNLKKALDVGCGTGRLVKFLNASGFEAFGCDISQEATRIAKRVNGRSKIFLAPATKLPAKNGSYDLITAISVIEHLSKNEAQKFLREATRVLKPHGFIFLVTPNFATPIRMVQGKTWFGYSDPTHVNFFTPRQLARELKTCALTNIRTRFQIEYSKSIDWEFPSYFAKLPASAKKFLIYLLFSSPFYIIRNSFWISAQKNGKA